jgi:hypothetical protein
VGIGGHQPMSAPKIRSWPVPCSWYGCDRTCSEGEAAEQEKFWESGQDSAADAGDVWAANATDAWNASAVIAEDGWTFFALCNKHFGEVTA